MTRREIAEWIVARWKAEDDPRLILWQLAHTSRPMTMAEVMAVVLDYVERTSENSKLKGNA